MSVGREARDHWASQEATARDEDFSDDPDDDEYAYTDRVPRPYPTSGLAKALADVYDPLFFRVRNGMRTA